MMGRSHVAIGTLTALVLTPHAVVIPFVVTMVSAALGSQLPDWDLKLHIKHRTITHWLLWPLLLYWFLPNPIGVGLAIGWGMHILADALTVEGVPALWPIPIRLRGFVHTGGITEWLVVAPVTLFLLWRVFA